MLEFGEITIGDKAIFDKYIRAYSPLASELSFTNFFMWRNFYCFRFLELNGYLCIISVPRDKEPFMFAPIGEFRDGLYYETVIKLKEYFIKNGWEPLIKRVTERELVYLKPFINGEGSAIKDRDNSDYIYSAKELSELSGKKYDGKRNHINKFIKEHDYEYVLMSQENMDDCIGIMNEWCARRSCDEHLGLYCEKKANIELLENFEKLGCSGALIKVEGRFEAFTVGEILSSDTAVIHIEKANDKIHGLYTLINRDFCKNNWRDVPYINREQDLGLEGLRKAKLSYHPVRMIDKYIVRL